MLLVMAEIKAKTFLYTERTEDAPALNAGLGSYIVPHSWLEAQLTGQ